MENRQNFGADPCPYCGSVGDHFCKKPLPFRPNPDFEVEATDEKIESPGIEETACLKYRVVAENRAAEAVATAMVRLKEANERIRTLEADHSRLQATEHPALHSRPDSLSPGYCDICSARLIDGKCDCRKPNLPSTDSSPFFPTE